MVAAGISSPTVLSTSKINLKNAAWFCTIEYRCSVVPYLEDSQHPPMTVGCMFSSAPDRQLPHGRSTGPRTHVLCALP